MPIIRKAIADLTPYDANPRTHPTKQVDQLATLIKKFGFHDSHAIAVDEQGVIIWGHGRLQAAKQAGLVDVPVEVLTGLSEEDKRALRIADNSIAEQSDWDLDLLQQELDALNQEGYQLELLALDDSLLEDLGGIFDPGEGGLGGGGNLKGDPDEVPEVDEEAEPVAKRGDVWRLGRHRVMCGDSTDAGDVARLMDGERVDMVFTDPPYGIGYSSDRYKGIKAQELSMNRNDAPMIIGDDADFDPSFLVDLFKSAKEVFVWGFQYYPDKLGRGGIIVWNKKVESQANCPHGDFELCWSKKERNKMCWLQWGGFNNKEKGEVRLHTTQKPVALAEWFFENWGDGLRIVVDLFGGSGSTLIAAEKTGRDCRVMELSPRYVDVIIKRWEDYTGGKAERCDGV